MTLSLDSPTDRDPKGWKIPLWFKVLFLSFVLIGGISLIWIMNNAYVESEVTGQVIRFSKRGILFKTYEGLLSTDSDVFINGEQYPAGTNWQFTVPKNSNSTILAAQQVVNQGRVKVKFKEKYFRFFWQADTRNVVQEIKKL